jgi:RNA polymerase sigma factor (sigma-70 family)
MTAVPNWDIVGPSGSDAELARASAAGDRTAFAGIYDRYADRLHDFCVGMLADGDGAADCVQDVFCIAATRLPQLRDPDKLRPWLYSIARNEALRRIRSDGAKHHPKSCPIRHRVSPVRKPWPRAPNLPI